MTLEELLKYIKEESEHLIQKYQVYDPHLRRLARMAKLTEEVGELSSEVLAFDKLQNIRKLEKHTKETLADEIADVTICTLLMADACDVDVKKALTDKIAKIKSRRQAQNQVQNAD